MSDFGTRLKNIRKIRDVTQSDLAKNIQVGQSTIANYENNTRFPGSIILKQISGYLEISLDYLLGLSEHEDIEQGIEEYDTEYDIEKIYLQLTDLLLNGDTEEARSIIKDISASGTSSLTIIEKIFIPILKLIGVKWERNEINIAEEHLVTGIIEKLFSYISESVNVKEKNNLTALFISPPGEDHIISLRMSTEYFRLKGWNTVFIGKSIPIMSLLEIIEKDKIDLIVLCAIIQDSINNASYLVEAIKSNLKDQTPKVLLGGNVADTTNEKLIKSFTDYHISSLKELSDCIDKIEKQILTKQ